MECHSGKYSRKRFFDSKPTILFKIPIFNATFLFFLFKTKYFHPKRSILIQDEIFLFKTKYFLSKHFFSMQELFFVQEITWITSGFKRSNWQFLQAYWSYLWNKKTSSIWPSLNPELTTWFLERKKVGILKRIVMFWR